MADILSTRNTPVLCDDFKIIIDLLIVWVKSLAFTGYRYECATTTQSSDGRLYCYYE